MSKVAENLTFNLDVDSSKAVSAINTFFDTFDKGAAQAKSKLNSAFNQTIQTDIKVEFKNGKLVAKEVQSLKQESNRLSQAYKAVNGELGKTPNALKRQKSVLVSLLGDTQKFKNGTRQVTAEWSTLTAKLKQVQSALNSMGSQGSNGLAGLTGRFIGIQTAANLATAGIMNAVRGIGDLAQTAVRMETLGLQMEAFVGNASEAEAAFDKFVDIAANSPLNLEQVAGAGKIMMAFGMETDEAIKATEQLALVSAATGGDINLLSRNLGQIVAQGRAYTRDLTQFAIQGIPIWEQLSVVTGKNVSELKEMATNGQITGYEVGQALDLMTAKGTAFAKIGERMQETFAGRFAAIEASTQVLAKAFVDSFNKIDKALGGPVSNSMKLFAEGIKKLAENMDLVLTAVAAVTVGIAAFSAAMVVLNWSAIGVAIGKIVVALKAWAVSQGIINVLMAFFQGLSGNFTAVAIGVASAATAAAVVATNMKKGQEETDKLNQELANTAEGVGEVTQATIDYNEQAGNSETVKQYKDQQEAVEGIEQALERAKEQLKKMAEKRNEEFEKEKQDIQDNMDLLKEKTDQQLDDLQRIKDAVNERYDVEKERLDEQLQIIRDRYDQEIAALREKTPSEQALYDLQKKSLEAKLAAGGLDKEEETRLRARLERMENNEKIQNLIVQKKEEEVEVERKLDELTEDKKTKLDQIEQKEREIQRQAEEAADRYKEQLKETEEEQKAFNQAIKDTLESAEKVTGEIFTTTEAVTAQRAQVQKLADDYARAAKNAQDLARALRNKAQAQSLNNPPSPPNAFAGGPVSGGSAYTVNELGKEAFLSASGALSMINAPAFGKWKAPSSGTIIPAHLTSQLDIPKSGVNINKTTGASPSGLVGGMNMGKLVSAITKAMRGDTVTNNVTIQSANTTQAASDIMVQLAKLKRLRYN